MPRLALNSLCSPGGTQAVNSPAPQCCHDKLVLCPLSVTCIFPATEFSACSLLLSNFVRETQLGASKGLESIQSPNTETHQTRFPLLNNVCCGLDPASARLRDHGLTHPGWRDKTPTFLAPDPHLLLYSPSCGPKGPGNTNS